MRQITLIGTDIQTSALGFGTAALMGKIGERESMRLLEVAYDCGIRHFDTAPLYGYGDSEAILGKFLRRRSDVTVATKVGLAARGWKANVVRRAKRFVRPFLAIRPDLRSSAAAKVRASVPPTTNFDPKLAAKSLVTSLRRLRRDQVDLLFLHECRAPDTEVPGLLEFLETSQQRGMIRAYGIATDFATIEHCVGSAPAFAKVVQFANSFDQPYLKGLPALSQEVACITHSPFGGTGKFTGSADPGSCLRYAMQENRSGIVLFSSQKVKHIVDNVRSVDECCI